MCNAYKVQFILQIFLYYIIPLLFFSKYTNLNTLQNYKFHKQYKLQKSWEISKKNCFQILKMFKWAYVGVE